MNPEKTLCFKSRENWRKWLGKNHDSSKEAWLVHYKKYSKIKGISLSDGVEEAICFGWIDGKLKSVDKDKFILRYSPRKKKSVWSKINKERAEKLIKHCRMTKAGLDKIEVAKSSGFWDNAYTNKKREKMPDVLKEAFFKNKSAWDNFRKFANTYRNMYIGWVIGAKTEETRTKRIKEVLKRSLLNKKPGIS